MRMPLAEVAVGNRAACVPALANGLFAAFATLFEQIGEIPLGDRLLDAACQQRRGVQVHGLIGREDRNIELREVALDRRRVGGDPREPVDLLDHDDVDRAVACSSRSSGRPPSRGTPMLKRVPSAP